MKTTNESKLDLMKVQYAIIKASWDELLKDDMADEQTFMHAEELLLQAEDALRFEFLDVAGRQTSPAELDLLKSISHTEKFFDVIMKGGC